MCYRVDWENYDSADPTGTLRAIRGRNIRYCPTGLIPPTPQEVWESSNNPNDDLTLDELDKGNDYWRDKVHGWEEHGHTAYKRPGEEADGQIGVTTVDDRTIICTGVIAN